MTDDLEDGSSNPVGVSGRVTGPGEVIADAGKWMRYALRTHDRGKERRADWGCFFLEQGTRDVCAGRQGDGVRGGDVGEGEQAGVCEAAEDQVSFCGWSLGRRKSRALICVQGIARR